MGDVYIKEDSWIAELAAYILKSKRMAIVIGNSIYLYKVSGEEFIKDKKWLKHELCHIAQYKKYGTPGFIIRYLIESIRHGYHNNCFEKEARLNETITQ